MKKKRGGRPSRRDDDDLAPHYDLEKMTPRPNRFAKRFKGDVIAVVLDADVAKVFSDSAQVNAFLRAAIAAVAKPAARRSRRRA